MDIYSPVEANNHFDDHRVSSDNVTHLSDFRAGKAKHFSMFSTKCKTCSIHMSILSPQEPKLFPSLKRILANHM